MRPLVLVAILAGCALPMDQGEVESEFIVTDLDWVCLAVIPPGDPRWPYYDRVETRGDEFAVYSSAADITHVGDFMTGEMLIDGELYQWTFGPSLVDGCVQWDRGRCCYH